MAEERHTAKRPWDTCREVPVIQDEQTPWKLVKLLKLLSLFIVSLLVFGLAICSKTSFLLLITLSSNATQTIPADQKPVALLSVGCALIAPSLLLLMKSLWKTLFKSSKAPAKATIAIVLFIEFLVALGSAVLTIVAMPFFDIVTNVMLLNSIAVLSSVFQIAAQCSAKAMNRFLLPSVFSLVLILLGYILFFLSYLMDGETRGEMTLWAGLAVAGTVLVSLSWWENYCSLFSSNSFLKRLSEDMTRSQNMLHILSSLLRILVTAAVLGAYIPLSNRDWTSLTTVPADVKKVVTILIGVQVVSSALCHWFVVVACKMHALRRSFIVPMYLASLAVLALFIGPVIIYFQNYSGLRAAGNYTFTEYCDEAAYGSYQDLEGGVFQMLVLDVTHTLCLRDLSQFIQIGFLGGSALAWWLGLLLATLHISFLKLPRIQRTQDLFVRRMYEGAFLEQSVLLNIRFEIQRRKKVKQPDPVIVIVYLCATMWHETYDEMMKTIISMFRLDKYRPKTEEDKQAKDVSFESHIYFDDSFQDVRGSSERHVNEYAETLVQVIREVYKIFMDEEDASLFKEQCSIPEQMILRTPYGGRLEVTLPHKNILVVHFKDKKLIRHKKRWSQIMYLYYLLGWKLNAKFYREFEEKKKEENVKGIELKSMEKELKRRLEKEKHNIYLLALDGDTDFQPASVMLLIDRMKLYPHVGAVCGRIHPTGTGPMVWYQKFEYAVGHWLQKTAEHVLGCVLCSPGCFSLFRAAALMDDNVMKRYTTKATEASHYVQYDQGEDRWLCTLLLQQGWRVEYNAASDAYTNAPQDFKEFYNQRRRWGPSTMANTMDLLGSGTMTSKRNKSISKPYIVYQIISMATSILGPATICLLIAGSFNFVLNMEPNGALVLAVVIPAIYLFLCFKLNSNTQITVAAVLSVLYAFLMLGTGLSIIGSIVTEKTILTPAGLFFISMVLIYFVTGLMHPQEAHLLIYGLMYMLCIPSAYLLLTIYSMANMNNVSWGTRETTPPAGTPKPTAPPQTSAQKAKSTITQLLLVAKSCKCPCWMPSREVSVSQENLISQGVVPVSLPLPQNTIVEDVGSSTEEERQEEPLPSPYVQQSWVSQLQNMSEELPLIEQTLDTNEVEFWRELQRIYLEPLAEDKEKQRKITNDLRELRNKVNFVYFICNALWLVATFSLQLIGTSVSIPIPKLNASLEKTGDVIYIDPIGFMFLLGFASLIFIQFFAMLYHRLYTLIHFVAFEDTESKSKKQQIREDSAKDTTTLDSGSNEEPDEEPDENLDEDPDENLHTTEPNGGSLV